MEEKIAIKVERCKAEEVRRKLQMLRLIDNDFKPIFEEGYVYFPVRTINGLDNLLKEYSVEVVRAFFEKRFRRPKNLRDALEKILPSDLHPYIPSSIDLVGDIALVTIPEKLESYSREIGRAIMDIYPRVKTVLSKQGETVGEYRIRLFNIIAGGPNTETIHREHGCIYKVDLMKAFFNPRMSGERLRVALQIRDKENILDMFAGVGPFSILLAKKNPTVTITAIELNPDAYNYLLTNISLNRVEDRVKALLGDAKQILKDFRPIFDRIIMDLPFNSLNFLDIALSKLKNYGVIHLYHVESGVDSIDKARLRVIKLAEEMGYRIEITYSRQVLEVAPRKFIIGLDIKKTS